MNDRSLRDKACVVGIGRSAYGRRGELKICAPLPVNNQLRISHV